jgi:hypothetical protein
MSELNKVKVTPKEGLRVRKENGQLIAAAGSEVVLNSYYRRRINDGDLLLDKSKKETATTAAKTGDK